MIFRLGAANNFAAQVLPLILYLHNPKGRVIPARALCDAGISPVTVERPASGDSGMPPKQATGTTSDAIFFLNLPGSFIRFL